MPVEDARRWNQRYSQDVRFHTYTHPRPFLLENAHYLPDSGLALDVAMGLGGNAALLIQRGLRVVGVDISIVALQQAKARLPGLMAVQADLTQYRLPEASFDVILNFYYLQRSLWQEYRRWLRPGGLLYLETLTSPMREIQPHLDPIYLLEPGELAEAFSDWETLVYQEGWQTSRSGHARAVVSLVARWAG